MTVLYQCLNCLQEFSVNDVPSTDIDNFEDCPYCGGIGEPVQIVEESM